MERVKQFVKVPVRHAATGQSLGTVSVIFRYDELDPYTLIAEFPQGKRWVWDRDMTYLGLGHDDRDPLGDGDVQLHREDGLLAVTLHGSEGAVTMLLPAAAMEAFLESTYRLVPAGSEELDIDSWILKLLP